MLDQNAAPEAGVFEATVSRIDADDDAVPETRRFEVDTAMVTAQCVKTDAHTRYLEITESANASETQEIAFADLAAGDKVDVYGTPVGHATSRSSSPCRVGFRCVCRHSTLRRLPARGA